MNADFDDARRGLQSLGFYTQAEAEGVEIERLGGLTNRVFMVSGPRGRHVLRIPGNGTEAYINRRVEAVAARAAARAGVSPEVIATTDDGLMLTVAIENAATMTPESFNANPAAVARAGAALAALHRSGEKFDFRFELFSMIDDYLKILKAKNASVPEGYPQALASAEDAGALERLAHGAHVGGECLAHGWSHVLGEVRVFHVEQECVFHHAALGMPAASTAWKEGLARSDRP